MNYVVTTAVKPNAALEAAGQAIAGRLSAQFTARGSQSLQQIKSSQQTETILVVARNKLIAHTPSGDFFFHPGMAQLRIKNLLTANQDHMIAAMGLTPGMSVLDCTLGLGADAIVASFIAGSKGQVTGLESSEMIALITADGLQNYRTDGIDDTLRRISVVHADYHRYLQALPDGSFDIVYFDPMFRRPVTGSSSIKPLRQLADSRPLTMPALQQALRVARRRVVLKETSGSRVFTELGFKAVIGGKYSSVHYGVIDTGRRKCSD